MPTLELFTADAFTTERPFSGNPAAVCLLESEIPEGVMRSIASELNLSETAFVMPLEGNSLNESTNFSLRWFTPVAEVDLCGHATLATAHVLYQRCMNSNPSLSFHTKSGVLVITKEMDEISLDFPLHDFVKLGANSDSSIEFQLAESIASGLEVEALYYCPVPKKLIVLLGSCNMGDLEALENKSEELLRIHPDGTLVRGIAVTMSPETDDTKFDFYSRYFAPWVGLNEDPATGSAHCGLGNVWSELKEKSTLRAKQCSKRGAEFHLEIKPGNRIELRGKARTFLSGRIEI